MPPRQPAYVGEHHPEGQAVYDRFMAANPNLRFRWDPSREPLTLGGMLIANPRARWGNQGSITKWGDVANYDAGLDHVHWFYDHVVRKWVLASLPNVGFSDRAAQLAMEVLQTELDRVNAEHRKTAPGRYRSQERLVAHIGAAGTSWRLPDHPLVVVASNLVSVNIDFQPQVPEGTHP